MRTNPVGTTDMDDPRSGDRPEEASDASETSARPLPPRPSLSRPLPVAGSGPNPTTAPRPLAAKKPRPDPGPIRIALGLTGVATATALMTAFLGPAGGASADTVATPTDPPAAAVPAPKVRHVIKYVQLKPGQTAPPKAVVKQAPAPKPRVVVVTTKQSGKR